MRQYFQFPTTMDWKLVLCVFNILVQGKRTFCYPNIFVFNVAAKFPSSSLRGVYLDCSGNVGIVREN